MSVNPTTTMRASRGLAFLLTLALSTPVAAQQNIDLGGDDTPDLNVQKFSPTPSPFGVFTVDSAQGSSDLQVSGGLLLNFAKDPLIVEPESGEPFSIVEQQLAADLLFALGLFDLLEVGVDLPIYFVNTASINNIDVQGATIGDLLIRPKFTLVNPESSAIGFALYANLGVPTGDTAAFTSSGSLSFRPGVIVDTKMEKLLLAANLGFNVQDERAFGNLEIASEMTFGLGVQYEVVDNFMLIGGEVFGSSAFNDFFAEEVTPLEGLLGLKLRTNYGLNFTLGGVQGCLATALSAINPSTTIRDPITGPDP